MCSTRGCAAEQPPWMPAEFRSLLLPPSRALAGSPRLSPAPRQGRAGPGSELAAPQRIPAPSSACSRCSSAACLGTGQGREGAAGVWARERGPALPPLPTAASGTLCAPCLPGAQHPRSSRIPSAGMPRQRLLLLYRRARAGLSSGSSERGEDVLQTSQFQEG